MITMSLPSFSAITSNISPPLPNVSSSPTNACFMNHIVFGDVVILHGLYLRFVSAAAGGADLADFPARGEGTGHRRAPLRGGFTDLPDNPSMNRRAFRYNAPVENLCDGSRRPVLGERHYLETSASGHMRARCPVCKARMVVRRVMGVIEFPRHEWHAAKAVARPKRSVKPDETKPKARAKRKAPPKSQARNK